MRQSRDRWIAMAMLAPSVILIAIFVYGFIASTAYTSMTDSNAQLALTQRACTLRNQNLRPNADGTMPEPQVCPQANFIGLRNYTDLFSSPNDGRFRIDVVNTIFFTGMFIVVCLGVGMTLAILLDQKIKGEGALRTIFLFPMALSFVVTGVVWKWLFNPDAGINILPTAIGLPAGTFRWFIDERRIFEFNWQDLPTILITIILAVAAMVAIWFAVKRRSRAGAFALAIVILMGGLLLTGTASTFNALARAETHGFNLALIALVVAAGWQMSGYTMAMYLAGLRGVPEELREAARVDGCSEVGVYRRIVFPLLAPITLSAIIILGHISLKIFDLVYVMGGGDLLYIDMLGLNMFFETFRGQNFGRGAAIAMIMLIMVAVVIIPYLWSNARAEAKRS